MHSVQNKYSSACGVCCDWQWGLDHLSSLGLTSPLTSCSLRACLPAMCVCTCVKIRSPPQVVLGRVLSTLFFWDKNSPWLRIDLFNWTSCLQSPRESGSCPCPSPSAVMTGLHHGSGNGLTLGAHPCLQAPCPLSSLSTHVSFLSNLILRNFPSKTYIPPHYCSCKRICVFRF